MQRPRIGIVQKVFSEKASAIAARMRQKYVKNASKWVLWRKEERSKNASEMRQNCVKNARNTFGGEHLLDDTGRSVLNLIPWTQNGLDRSHTTKALLSPSR